MSERAERHLLIVDSWQAFGGGERYVLQLVEGLRGRGFRFTVAGADERFLAAAEGAGARVARLRLVRRQRSTWQILIQLASWPLLVLQWIRLLRRAGDVRDVHITTLEEQMLATPLFALMGRRVTWSVHGRVGVKYNPLQRLLYLVGARFAERIIAVSEGGRSSLLEAGVDPARVVVVPNGVELPEAFAQEVAGATARVGFVGRLEPIKDPLLFLEAAERALARGSSAEFVLYGAGAQEAELRRLIEERGLSKRVRLAGYVDDAAAIYRAIDVLMLTSRSEGLPFALLEAGAAGVPAIVPEIEGMAGVVVDGVTGLIGERTPDALAAAVLELSEDPERRARMGSAARRHIGERFTSSLMLERTAAILLEA